LPPVEGNMPREKWPLRLARWVARAAVVVGALVAAYKHSEQVREFAFTDVPEYVRKLTSGIRPGETLAELGALPKDIADRDKCLQGRDAETLASNARFAQLQTDAEGCYGRYDERQCAAFKDRYALYLESRKLIAEKCRN
jgi:hypothetical protein